MAARTAVLSPNAPAPSPLMSQAVIYNNTVYCSGSLGIDHTTGKFVDGGAYERTAKALKNLGAVLEAAGSSLSKTVKVNIFLSSMDYYADVNRAYGEAFTSDPKPVSFCAIVPLPSSRGRLIDSGSAGRASRLRSCRLTPRWR
ncbi:Protein mmf1, mitochondrial [Diplodia seriata]|uniref:Protein mmf1, mitochondrial n=1 Tax=Diplodia seriata TaxID=420778 RepID=A0A1S8BA51_9PEZI|nr:Protein mmf1, mitochondrial [Diplodia seriata]